MTDGALNPREDRGLAMLHTAFGPEIRTALKDDAITEVMLNGDGSLWCDHRERGMVLCAAKLSPADGERIIRLVASYRGAECHEGTPILSTELPGSGERFEGLLPPIVIGPVFSIRKPSRKILLLSDYVRAQILSPAQALLLTEAIEKRHNILIVGGTGSGKTTLANALLAEIPDTERLLLLEDTRELHCSHPNQLALKTRQSGTHRDAITLRHLVRSTLRLRPDRIIVGEVRGAEALDLLKSWNTGHPGGLTTLHAGSVRAGLVRLEQLIQEEVPHIPRALIAEAVDLILYLDGRGASRRVTEIAALTGFEEDSYQLTYLSGPDAKSSPSITADLSLPSTEPQERTSL